MLPSAVVVLELEKKVYHFYHDFCKFFPKSKNNTNINNNNINKNKTNILLSLVSNLFSNICPSSMPSVRKEKQFVNFKPLAYCFQETIGSNVKALFVSRPMSRIIR